jgi:hypothetical protein
MPLHRLARALGAAFILCAGLGGCHNMYDTPYALYDAPNASQAASTAAAVACSNTLGANNGGMRSDYIGCVSAHQ